MVVCSCLGINERRVRREIDQGASTIEEIAVGCKAGSCCQNCHPFLDELLAERCRIAMTVKSGRRRYLIA